MLPHDNVIPVFTNLHQVLGAGHGLVYFDHTATRDRYADILAAAHACGREADVLVLNFPVKSPAYATSNTYNPFAHGHAETIRELLVSQLEEQSLNDVSRMFCDNGVFRERAVALIGTIAPALVWLRDNKGVPLNIDLIRFAFQLRWIEKLAVQKIYLLRDPDTGEETEIDVSGETPEEIIGPLKAYLGELPTYDKDVPLYKQGDEPGRQHGYAIFFLSYAFSRMAVDLRHVFLCETPDVDMDDVISKPRILVVRIPSLEVSYGASASLIRLVLTTLRIAVSARLAAALSSSRSDRLDDVQPTALPHPILVRLDNADALADVDRLMALGRSIGVRFCLGFEDPPAPGLSVMQVNPFDAGFMTEVNRSNPKPHGAQGSSHV